jgi:hypothetical protein
MSLSNTVQFVVSRHRVANGAFGYRVHMADGSMRILTEQQVRCCVSGDQSLLEFDPEQDFEGRPPPTLASDGPNVNDIIRVHVGKEWHVGTIIDKRPNGTYRVKYDDDMFVQDKLSLPWEYVAVAPAPPLASAPEKRLLVRIKLTEPLAQAPTQPSAKALGKRKMPAEDEAPAAQPPAAAWQRATAKAAQTAQAFAAQVDQMAHEAATEAVASNAAPAPAEERAPAPAPAEPAELSDSKLQAILRADSLFRERYDSVLECL